MKAVILAGGYGTRISEESAIRPKPMVEIGEKPILWHVMKHYSAYGVHDFIICCGYKSFVIKEFFAGYVLRTSEVVTFDLGTNAVEASVENAEPWRVTLVETGEKTLTGGRLKRVADHLDDDTFFFTYGDCVSNIDLDDLLGHHRSQETLATLTAVQPPGRFGVLTLDEDRVTTFMEKPEGDGGWVNGGYFVLEPGVLDYIEDDSTVWEREPLQSLAEEGQLTAYKHHGFWHPMDTLRDKMVLEEHWATGHAPWMVWEGARSA
jgi:glucose-1-phosphate cytidylyltransferase